MKHKKYFLHIAIFTLTILCTSQTTTPFKIIEKPINYNAERQKLSLEYLQQHHNLSQTKPTIIPKIIVLHYTAGGTLESNYKYFNNTYIDGGRKVIKNQSNLNVGAHYLVDRDGSIYHLIPDTLFARHTIGLNYCAIGVENIGSKQAPLTNAQVEANAQLIRHLCKKHKIEYIIGHSEYGTFKTSKLWRESNPKYFTGKEDPGNNFLIAVRKLIGDLKLKYKP